MCLKIFDKSKTQLTFRELSQRPDAQSLSSTTLIREKQIFEERCIDKNVVQGD